MEVESFDAVNLVVAQVLQAVRTTHVRTERVQDLVSCSVRAVKCTICAIYPICIVTVPKVQFPFKSLGL